MNQRRKVFRLRCVNLLVNGFLFFCLTGFSRMSGCAFSPDNEVIVPPSDSFTVVQGPEQLNVLGPPLPISTFGSVKRNLKIFMVTFSHDIDLSSGGFEQGQRFVLELLGLNSSHEEVVEAVVPLGAAQQVNLRQLIFPLQSESGLLGGRHYRFVIHGSSDSPLRSVRSENFSSTELSRDLSFSFFVENEDAVAPQSPTWTTSVRSNQVIHPVDPQMSGSIAYTYRSPLDPRFVPGVRIEDAQALREAYVPTRVISVNPLTGGSELRFSYSSSWLRSGEPSSGRGSTQDHLLRVVLSSSSSMESGARDHVQDFYGNEIPLTADVEFWDHRSMAQPGAPLSIVNTNINPSVGCLSEHSLTLQFSNPLLVKRALKRGTFQLRTYTEMTVPGIGGMPSVTTLNYGDDVALEPILENEDTLNSLYSVDTNLVTLKPLGGVDFIRDGRTRYEVVMSTSLLDVYYLDSGRHNELLILPSQLTRELGYTLVPPDQRRTEDSRIVGRLRFCVTP